MTAETSDPEKIEGHLECTNPACEVGPGRSIVLEGFELREAPCHSCGELLTLRVSASNRK